VSLSSGTEGAQSVKKIDLESHFATEAWIEALRHNKGYPRLENGGERLSPEVWNSLAKKAQLLDMSEGRIAYMDAARIDRAYLSLTSPGVEQFDPAVGTTVAEDANDLLAAAIAEHPDRFGGFATLAPKDVDHAVHELERCVRGLGFRGWNTHSNFGDSYLDDPRYRPILAKAQELDIPIYLHPAVPMIPEIREFGFVLAGPSFGFGVEVAFVFMRMIVRGVFDELPGLKIIMGHYGEALPFLVNRVDCAYRQGKGAPNAQFGAGSERWAGEYIKSNLWVTTSGNYFPAAYVCSRDGLGLDRILLGSDFPYENMGACTDFLDGLALPEDERLKVYQCNADALGF
jgi:predicted TIM-barrel fold metal-dependent hydrolase